MPCARMSNDLATSRATRELNDGGCKCGAQSAAAVVGTRSGEARGTNEGHDRGAARAETVCVVRVVRLIHDEQAGRAVGQGSAWSSRQHGFWTP